MKEIIKPESQGQLETEADRLASLYAKDLAKAEADRVVKANIQMGKVTGVNSKDALWEQAYKDAYELHYWELYHKELKRLSGNAEE